MRLCSWCGEVEAPLEISLWLESHGLDASGPLSIVCMGAGLHHFIEAERPPASARRIGARLYASRDYFARLELADVERLTGIPALTVRRIENGTHAATFDEIRALCRCYGQSLDDLAKCAATAAG